MFYVYILKSLKDNDLYIGRTNNIDRRIKEHNNGKVSSTKSRRPFIFLKIIETDSERESVEIEKEYKKGFRREQIKREFKI